MSIAFAAIALLQVLSVAADENVALGLDFQPAAFGGVIKAATTTLPFGCTVYAAYVDDCESSTTSFDYLPASVEASCLCYDAKTSWDPTFFDSAILECASWASTASTAIYSGLHAHESFCSKQGDVRAAKTTGAGATTTKSSGTGTPATTPKPTSGTAVATGGSGITGCSNVAAAITSCEAATTGFIDMSGSQQASCICYAGTTSWAPSVFDDQVHSCVTYLSTASPSRYSTYRSLESFCSIKGNVRTNTASVLTTAGSATRSVVILQTNPATPSIGSDSSSASSTSTQAVVVVTVQASSSTSTPAPTRPSAGVSVKAERIFVLLGLTFVVATLGACILL